MLRSSSDCALTSPANDVFVLHTGVVGNVRVGDTFVVPGCLIDLGILDIALVASLVDRASANGRGARHF